MTASNIDLVNIFQQVSQALDQNQQALNQADEFNQDHGDHMVETFRTITDAMQKRQSQGPKSGLNYAARVLSRQASSGSGKLYAEGLKQAARQVKADEIDPQIGMSILQALLSGGQPAPQSTPPLEQKAAPAPNGLLDALLGGASGSQESRGGGLADGLDVGDLLTAGLAFFQSKQSGADNLSALVSAVTAASGMGKQAHRQQSTQLVADAFLKALNQQAK